MGKQVNNGNKLVEQKKEEQVNNGKEVEKVETKKAENKKTENKKAETKKAGETKKAESNTENKVLSKEEIFKTAVKEVEEIVDYYFTNNGRINKIFLEREIKVVLQLLYDYQNYEENTSDDIKTKDNK